jgi:aldehyde dehydrogenase (NAD+)
MLMACPDLPALLAQLDVQIAASATHPSIAVHAPRDASLLGHVAAAGTADYERVLELGCAAARDWAAVPAPQRGALVGQLGAELHRHQGALATLVSLETGKPLSEAQAEIQETIEMAAFARGQSRMLYGRTMHSERPGHRLYEQWHPLGLTGVITAFNFPAGVWAWNAMLAAVCGNACIWKPSPKAALSSLAVLRICERVLAREHAPPIFQLLLDTDGALGERLAADARIGLLSFTGSTRAGRQVAQAVAARLGRSLLELGGNGAVIVDQSADLALATRAIVEGATATSGQRCTSTRRVLVERSCLPELQQRLLRAYGALRIGDPLDPSTQVGPLIDAAAVQQFERALEAARAQGGLVLCGGAVLPHSGYYVEPAIVLARNDWPIVQQETFAPILYLIPFDSLIEAIGMQNACAHGLSSALFTRRLGSSELFLSHGGSDCGIANINIGTGGVEIGGAFGGEKDTGGGREAGSDAWQAYMRRQTSTINWAPPADAEPP